jgi:hypothetical protein
MNKLNREIRRMKMDSFTFGGWFWLAISIVGGITIFHVVRIIVTNCCGC